MQRAFQHIFLIILCLGATSGAVAQFTDDFSDNDFTMNPAWSGDDALFTAATGQLQSQSPGAATYYLSTPSALSSAAQWTFFVNLKFATSGSNYADVYLMSDAADLTTTQNGYFVRIGSTTDDVVLYSRVAGTNTALITSPPNIVNSGTNNPFIIQVKRDLSDNWTLQYDDGASGTFVSAGTIMDASVNSSTHFGMLIVQSAAAGPINNHFFDDFYAGPIIVDLDPPMVDTVIAINATQIDVKFNEPVDQATAEDVNNYDIQPFNSATAAVLDGTDPTLVHVTPAFPLTNMSYNMIVSNVQDLAGNAMGSQQFTFSFFTPATPSYRSVVINELLPDPTPVVGLPEVEFVELFNTSTTDTYDLAGWKISDGSSTGTLPSYILPPQSYALIVKDANAVLFPFINNVIPIGTLPSLNNTSDAISLKDASGNLIDAANYDLSWYGDPNKDDGGYTMEQINPFVLCASALNWHASNAQNGGTPGVQNSVYALTTDQSPPQLLNVLVVNPTTIELVFNEVLDTVSVPIGNYTIQPSLSVAAASNVPTSFTNVRLQLGSAMSATQVYTITVTNVADCPGNVIMTNNTAQFGLPQPPAFNDVVINEVLYDPTTTGSDFVELYNRSDKVFSLAGWKMANGNVGSELPITLNALLLLPGQYLLLTEDAGKVAAEYPMSQTGRFLVTDLPSYNNGSGTVILRDSSNNLLDQFNYDDDLHFSLLNSVDGVSLERISPFRPTSDNTNWHSASELVGSATPGYQNSQYALNSSPSGEVAFDNAIFSPDNDGFQDVATLNYRFEEPGFVGSITIYDTRGREVRKLMENELLGVSGSISWDGIGDDNEKGRVGPYILFFEVFDLSGNTLNFKETLVLAHKLN